MPKRTKPPTLAEVEQELDAVIDLLKDETFDAISNEILLDDRKLGQVGANKAARVVLNLRWKTRESRLGVVSGKAVLTHIARWSQDQFGVSLNSSLIARSMRPSEVPLELRRVLEAIAKKEEFLSVPADAV